MTEMAGKFYKITNIRTHALRVTVVIKQKLVHILYNIDTTLISETKVVTFLLQQTPVFMIYFICLLSYMPFTMYAFYHICLLPRMPFPTYAFSHGLHLHF